MRRKQAGVLARKIRCGVGAGLLGLLGGWGTAYAGCTLVTSPSTVDMGRMTAGALPAADADGLRKMGERVLTVSGTCDTSQAAVKLQFSGLQPVPGKHYVAWGSGGGLKLHLSTATVGGVPVDIALEGVNGGQYVSALDLAADSTVVFNLAQIPAEKRNGFTIQIRVTAALPQEARVTSETRFSRDFTVSLVN